MQLQKGDVLLLYTDGVSESQNPRGEEFGVQNLMEVLKTRPPGSPQDLIRSCVSNLASFRSGISPGDDLALLAIERTE
jgi:sigma-B regulation protein RsbU (phosphoserine phosphatase)